MAFLFESQYFPPQCFYACLLRKPIFIESNEHYQKRSLRNKCIIQNANGLQVLTIPLLRGKHQQMNICRVEISYGTRWQVRHLQAIRSAYGSAPYFDHYYGLLETEMLHRSQYLIEFNTRLTKFIASLLGIPWQVSFTEKYERKPNNLIDHRQYFTPRNFSKVSSYLSYPQVFSEKHPFTPNLSILDILFCQGPEAITKLRKMNV
ncbi:MAG: hypothetical protein HKN87_04355 [Saprospiraceae bacterium]|nr:hypothetical protein [Saprospiraceae bacterium]